MAETLDNSQEDATVPADLQPALQPEAIGGENGGPSVPLCGCGQPRSVTDATRCAHGHQWAGGKGSGGAATQGDEPPPAVVDIDATAALKRGIQAVDKEIARIAARLDGRLKPKQRSTEQRLLTDMVVRIAPLKRELDAAEEAARAKARADNGLKVTFGGRYQPDAVATSVLRKLSDEQLKTVLGWLGASTLEDVDPEGPAVLRMELTDNPAMDFQRAPSSPSTGIAQPDAIAKRFIEPVLFVPQGSRPMLAVNNVKPAPEAEPTFSQFDLDADERRAAWRRAHGLPVDPPPAPEPAREGSITVTSSEPWDMPPGPSGRG
jgi:hypothetical protein